MERSAFMPAVPQVNNGISASSSPLRSAPPGMVMSSPMMPQMEQMVEMPYDPLQQPEPQQPNGGSSYSTLGWLSILALATGGAFMAGKKGSQAGSAATGKITGGLNSSILSMQPLIQSQSCRGDLVTMSAAAAATETETTVESECINSIRFLAVDAINKSGSGHPGAPMGQAPIGYLLMAEETSLPRLVMDCPPARLA
jgi:hypothetical protein